MNAPEAAPAYADLRALRTVGEAGWAAYLATNPADDRHVVMIPFRPGQAPRTLWRGEAFDWCDGLCVAAGGGDRVARLADEEVPELVRVADAARMIPAASGRGGPWLSPQGVAWNVNAGNLYALYGRYRDRWLFEAQVRSEALDRRVRAAERTVQAAARAGEDADARAAQRDLGRLMKAAETAQREWLQIRRLLPPPSRPSAAEVSLRPKPSPDPLPIDPALHGVTQRVAALMVADGQGWIEYRHPTADSTGYVVRVDDGAGGRVERTLSHEAVLPWLLGVADWYGRADLVAYRPDLG